MAALGALLLTGSLVLSYIAANACAHALAKGAGMRGRARSLNGARTLARARESVLEIGPVAHLVEKAREKRRAEEFERGMPEVLRLLGTALESGSSLVMALDYAARNCDGPLAEELRRTVWDLDAGHGFDEALESLRHRTHGSEFAYLAIAMEIQHQSGGSLTGILESVSGMLQQSAELKDELRTKTSQGRLSSKIVAIMPFALLGLLSVFSPDYLANLFGSPIGVCLFSLALMLELLGILMVRRTLAIDFTSDIGEGA